MRHAASVLTAFLVTAGGAAAQEPAAPPASHTERPGLWRAGPFYITPRLRIGELGLDTNVFYTATDRRTDFTVNGGPGLEIVLPLRSARFLVEGGGNYVFFLRTESQRRLAGDARARLEIGGPRVMLGVEGGVGRSFDRPSFEVDRRVIQDSKAVRADLSLIPTGRLGARLAVSQRDLDVPDGQPFRGADLTRNLSRREQVATLGFRLRVSAKTSLLAEGDYQRDRFTLDESRDSDSNRIYGGFEVASTTRLSGRAVGGVRLFRFLGTDRRLRAPYANVALTYHIGPRTRLTATQTYDVSYTAFTSVGRTPTVRTRVSGLRLEKGLFGRVDLQTYGTYTTLRTDGAVLVALPSDATRVVRADRIREAGANLGYRFPWRLRIGFGASYTERQSPFTDLGLEGLLLGGTVSYTPD